MKHFKNFLSILLVFVIALCTIQTVNAAEMPADNVSFYISDEIYNDIKSNDEVNAAFMRQDKLLQDYYEITKTLSEEQLAGAYFDENGKLHIMITEDVPVQLENCDIYYEFAQYSYSQLEKFQEIINEYSDEIGFTASGIDQEDNKVVIYSVSDLDVELLNGIIPEDSVKIVREDHTTVTNCATTVEPGTQISNTSNLTYGSITCGVVWDYSATEKKYGFMTTGHLGSVGDNVSYGGYAMGTITKKQESGSVDAALILNGQNNNIFNYSNSVSDGKVFDYFGGSWPQNTVIYAYGATSTSMDGKITDTSYSNTFAGIKFTDLVLTDASAQGGDSGGPVLTSYSNNYAIIGAIKGRVNGNMVYVNMSNIESAFDLKVYSHK